MSGGDDERPLVERDEELRVISQLVEDVRDAVSALTLQVVGEPGIGKSRLLRELTVRAQGRGHLVLTGRAAEFEGEHPFGVFTDALEDYLVSQERERLEEIAGGFGGELAAVFAAFAPLASGHAPQLQQERYRAYGAVRRLLGALASDAPVVVVLDDVQWADPASVELMCHLLAHPCRGPVLVALGLRPAQVSPQLRVALASGVRDHGAHRLDLAPLSAAAANALLGPKVTGSQCDRLYRESGGNPFFLLQLARGDALADRLRSADVAGASGVPDAVRGALASELSSLSAPALVLLQGAAVVGDPFDGRLAAGAGDIGQSDAPELVDELLRSQLVYPTAVPGRFAFRHPIIRAILYALAASGWRVRAHARVAALLAADQAGAAAQAPHVERSAVTGDDAAIALLVAAAASSANRAPALAARWYAAALRLLPETRESEAQRVELLLALATAHSATGQLRDSRGALCEVLERLDVRHPARMAVVASCAGVEHLLGRHRDAHARLALARRALDADASIEAVLLDFELAAGAAYETRADEMLALAQRALQGASRLGQPALEVAAAGQVALARYFVGLPAFDAVDRAGAALDALDDAQLATRLDIGLWVGWTESVLERHERAVAHCQRVIDVARATRQGATLLVTMTAQAWSLIRMGRLDDAETALAAAIETGRLAPNLFFAVAVGLSSVLATHRGQLDAAVRAGEESVRLARSADPGLIPGMSGLYLAIPLIEIGTPRRARDAVLEMSGGSDLRTSRSGHTAACEALTRAELALGHVDAAEAWAAKAQAATHGHELGAEAAFAQRATSAVTLARGDAAAAAQIALDGAVGAADAGAPVEAARCQIVAAKALVQAGRRADAITELQSAAAALGRIGAHGYRAEADKALLRLGHRSTHPTSSSSQAPAGHAPLTDREREISELVRRGHTNRQIAAATFLSEKTVERHLSRIFTKLGVSRRTELALYAATGDEHID